MFLENPSVTACERGVAVAPAGRRERATVAESDCRQINLQKCKDGLEEAYDGGIIGAHAPDALKILGNQATYDELRILGAFQYACSDLFLHHDDNLMPKSRGAWGSRNFLGTTNGKACVTTWLNNH